MKVRSGFVSNSSSSSFMAIVKDVSPEDVNKENKDRIRIYSQREYGEGYPYWTPSEDELKIMIESKSTEPFMLVDEIVSAYDEDSLEMKKDLLPTIAKIALEGAKDYRIIIFDKSYHQPENLRDFIDES